MQNRFLKYCLLLLFAVSVPQLIIAQNDAAQNARAADDKNETFILSGTIFDDELMEPIGNANVEITGGAYTTSNSAGDFRIRARVGDQLIVTSDAFETVYYDIQDDQTVRILVKKAPAAERSEVSKKKLSTRSREYVDVFPKYIDSAKQFLNNWLAHDYHHIRQINAIQYDFLKSSSGEALNYAGKW